VYKVLYCGNNPNPTGGLVNKLCLNSNIYNFAKVIQNHFKMGFFISIIYKAKNRLDTLTSPPPRGISLILPL